ncbi:hypothetical protein, partial [Streptomyces sp. E5N91]|uniref:hypothetical protein n=1 Tax=Streptomyces sp. E5N91 TaxID=1851996 RepID=UPI001EE96F9A
PAAGTDEVRDTPDEPFARTGFTDADTDAETETETDVDTESDFESVSDQAPDAVSGGGYGDAADPRLGGSAPDAEPE